MTENPYQATAASVSAPPKSDEYVFRSLRTLAIVVTAMMVPILVCLFGGSAVETIAGSMFPNFSDPNAEVSSAMEMNFVYASIAFGGLAGLLQLAIAVPVCMFLYRANANLRALGHQGLEFTPGWCGGWWFVPILNLFKPYGATKEIYINSQRLSATLPGSSAGGSAGLLGAWWGCWVIGSLLSNAEGRLALRGVDTGAMTLPLSWGSSLLLIGAGLMFLSILWNISRWQSTEA